MAQATPHQGGQPGIELQRDSATQRQGRKAVFMFEVFSS